MTRAPGFRLRLGALLFALYAAIAVVTLGANPLRGETITPFDVLISQRAWKYVDPEVEVRSYQRSDILNALLPTWEVAKQQIRDGQAPLWNDKVAGGGTMFSVSTTLFTPAFAIFAATPDPALGFYLATLVNLALAGLGMHVLLRRRLGWLASFVGAVTFEFCGFNAAWLYWPHMFTLMWAPWLFYAVDRCSERPGPGTCLGVGAASSLVMLGGFPFLSMLTMEAAALYTLVLLWAMWRRKQQPWPFAMWCFGGAVLGLLLAFLPLLGLMHWLQQFDLGYRAGRGSYLDPSYWKHLLPPWSYQAQRVEETMYVGALAIILALVGLGTLFAGRRRAEPLTVFALLLFVITSGLVFEHWPRWLVGWLPGMSFNSWSRAIGLMDLSLAILAGVGLDAAWRFARGRHRVFQLLAILGATAQVVELTSFFRDFNGPVDARYYFPRTPTIQYVVERSGPFDYALTDRSFLMSGTLGAYGQREWLAHYFRSPELQRVLKQMAKTPFHSHLASASRFPASEVHFDAQVLADHNVRYALVDARHGPDAQRPATPRLKGAEAPLPPAPPHTYSQGFRLSSSLELTGIAVRIATYHQTGLRGTLALTVTDAAGTPVAQGMLAATLLSDNEYAHIHLLRPVVLPPGNYSFKLQYESEPTDNRPVSAWSVHRPLEESVLEIDGQQHSASIQYRLLTGQKNETPFRRVFTANGTSVLENTASPGGPYFVANLRDPADAQASGPVDVLAYQPARFKLRYRGHAHGLVVVPMSGTREWSVTVDGRPVVPELKGGVMPAVPVTGPATIEFNYRPAALAWLPLWAMTTLLAVAGLWFARWRASVSRRSGKLAGQAGQ